MKIQLPLLLFLLISPAFRGLGQNDIGLASPFGEGMVLQRSANTLLRGFGPPGKTLAVRFWSGSEPLFFWGSPRWTVLVDKSGYWKTNIDLTPTEFQSHDKPWTLQIQEDKNNKRKYQNIIIGDVIIVAGWEKQGITAGIPDFVSGTYAQMFARHKDDIRFLDLTNANLGEDFKHASGTKWESWPEGTSNLNRYSTLTIRMAYELAESKIPELSSNRYIGIVLASRKVLENALDPVQFNTSNEFKPRDTNIWPWIVVDASNAKTFRSLTLITNKHLYIVSNIPPIISYDAARWCSREDVDAKNPSRAPFSFAGAIWSTPSQEK